MANPTVISELLIEFGIDADDADKAAKKVAALEKQTKKFGKSANKDVKGFGGAFRRLASSVGIDVKKLRGRLGKARKAIGKFAKGIAVVGAAVIGAAVGIFRFVQKTTETIDALNKLATATGISIEELQRLEFAAGQSGAKTEDLTRGIRRLNQNLADIASGGGKAAKDALAELGLTFEDLQGLPIEDKLGLIGDRINLLGDDIAAVTLSARIFGEEAGPRLQSLLKEGTAGIKELGAEANVLTQEQADKASAFQDQLGETQNQLKGVFQGIAVDLLPAISELVTMFQGWVDENQDLIKQNLPKLLQTLVPLFKQIGTNVQRVLTVFGFLFDKITAIDTFMNDKLGESWKDIKVLMFAVIDPLSVMIRGFERLVQLMRSMGTFIPVLQQAVSGLENLGIVSKKKDTKFNARKGAAAVGRVFQESGVGQLVSLVQQQGGVAEAGEALLDKAIAAEAAAESAKRQQVFDFLQGKFAAKTLTPQEAKRFSEEFGIPLKEAKKGVKKSRRPVGRGSAKAKEKEVTSGVTVQDAIDALLTGDPNALNERLQGLSAQTPKTSQIKPTVAIDFFSFTVTQNFTGDNPVATGSASAQAIRKVFQSATAKAANALQPNLVR